MNHNFMLKCDICDTKINIRWQIGFVERTPVRITCPICNTKIKMILIIDNINVDFSFETQNASVIPYTVPDFFGEVSSELLTFKISKQKLYSLGDTPFMRASQLIGIKEFGHFQGAFLTCLSLIKEDYYKFERLNYLYYNSKPEFLLKELGNTFGDFDNSANQEELIIRILYDYNINFFSMFIIPESFGDINEKIINKISYLRTNKKEIFENYLEKVCTKQATLSYEKKIFDSIKLLLMNFNQFIPAMFLKYVSPKKIDSVYLNYTVTTASFDELKNIYISIYENVLSIYNIILPLNNIYERGSINSFPNISEINNKKIKSLSDISKLTKGDIVNIISNNEGFDVFFPNFNRKIRNSIGHEDWDYDEIDHKIVYGNEEIYLLEYLFELWQMLPKLVSLYKIMQDIKILKFKLASDNTSFPS